MGDLQPVDGGCGGVYAIVNTATGDFYIGGSLNMYQRWLQHTSKLKNGYHHCPALQDAYNHHGESAFTCTVITYLPDDADFYAHEQYYSDLLHPLYNTYQRFWPYDAASMPQVDVAALRTRIVSGPYDFPRWTRRYPLAQGVTALRHQLRQQQQQGVWKK